jgi:uncharacterized iron-regulated membrane protein
MYYVLGLVLVAMAIELLAWRKVWGPSESQAAPAPQPVAQPVFREYLPAEIRVIEKEAAYQRELRAARRGHTLPQPETTFRGLPYVSNP